MKNTTCLLSLAALTAVTCVSDASAAVKVMQAADFNSLALDQVQTSAQYSAGTAGQGGWLTSGGGSSYYNIVADPTVGSTRGRSMSIQGSSSNTSRYAWTGDVAANWGSRDAGSDQIWAVWDQNTSTFNSGSLNRFGAHISSAAGDFLTGLTMQVSTGQLYGLSYSTSGGIIGNYAYPLGSSAILNRDTWYSFAITFNKTTGKSQFGFKNLANSTWNMFFVNGAAAGVNPNEFDFFQHANNSTSQGKAYFDNLLVSSASGTFVPAPGALALLGVAGLVGARRRRAHA